MATDIEIANSIQPTKIREIAESLGLDEDDIELYGNFKAKVSSYSKYIEKVPSKSAAKLVLVTAINPTPAGEGKTTTSVGLADSLSALGKRTIVALREPSLGPVFGVKGGAAGGGYAQVIPMEDINLHFTGDFHAIGAANNLLAAMIDNHIKQGNVLQIDPMNITWKRVVDMNDRQLRSVIDGVANGKSGTINGVTRPDGFDITVASEVMAVFCLATSIADLRERLGRMVVAYTFAGAPVTAGELEANGAMAALLKDAIKPNLVQTLEKTPAIIHGGPFANIAHGCNSVIATKTALGLVAADAEASKSGEAGYVVTEAGFGADLGAEKFIDIKCRLAGLAPDAAVVVATVRALKSHGGVAKLDLNSENVEAVKAGLPNLLQHVQNMREVFGLNAVVALNKFPTDTEAEVAEVLKACKELGVEAILSDVWALGSKGGAELAQRVIELCESPESTDARANVEPKYAYDLNDSIEEKLTQIVTKIYHGAGVSLTLAARKQAEKLTELGFANLPICMAKTQYSFSDNQRLLGAPSGFTVNITNLKVSAGAGFIVALTGDVMTMPGLPKVPAANSIDVTPEGDIVGLF